MGSIGPRMWRGYWTTHWQVLVNVADSSTVIQCTPPLCPHGRVRPAHCGGTFLLVWLVEYLRCIPNRESYSYQYDEFRGDFIQLVKRIAFLNIILGRITRDWHECMFTYTKARHLKSELSTWLTVLPGSIVENVNREIKTSLVKKRMNFYVHDSPNIIRPQKTTLTIDNLLW